MNEYRTIENNGLHEIEIKKSRFIAHLKRTENEEEAVNFIEKIRKEHWKATHNCTAYTIGMKDEIQRYDDDGEPSGTAGIPMLELLKNKELKNVVAVVTRYFGGIKLGAGGLIRAYSGSVNEAVKALGVVKRQKQLFIDVTVDYSLSGALENKLRESNYILNDITYTDKVTYHCVVPIEAEEIFTQEIIDFTSARGTIDVLKEGWIEIPVEP